MRSDEPELPNPQSVLKAAERVDRCRSSAARCVAWLRWALADAGDSTLFVNLHPEDLSDESLYERVRPSRSLRDASCSR